MLTQVRLETGLHGQPLNSLLQGVSMNQLKREILGELQGEQVSDVSLEDMNPDPSGQAPDLLDMVSHHSALIGTQLGFVQPFHDTNCCQSELSLWAQCPVASLEYWMQLAS